MLNLNARIDFHEIEIVALDVVEKLDRAGVAVADRGQQIDRRLVQSRSRRARQRRGGRLLDHLLIAPLHRAIAFAEMQHAAVAEAHRPAPRHGARARHSARDRACRRRTPPWLRSRRAQSLRRAHFGVARDDHAAPAAAGRRLGHHGKADRLRRRRPLRRRSASFSLPGVIGTPAAWARRRADELVADRLDRVGASARQR